MGRLRYGRRLPAVVPDCRGVKEVSGRGDPSGNRACQHAQPAASLRSAAPQHFSYSSYSLAMSVKHFSCATEPGQNGKADLLTSEGLQRPEAC